MSGRCKGLGGVILCGGRSTRMGRAKASLPFGDETMLTRVVRLLGEAAWPLVVVAAAGQELPRLEAGVTVVHDRREGCGPLEGLLVGLGAMRPLAEKAFVTSCDVPLLKPEVVRQLDSLLGEDEIVAPREGSFFHPLAAIYRTALAERIEALIREGGNRPQQLIEKSRTRTVNVEELRSVDPRLDTFRNLNRPGDYLAAVAEAGLRADPSVAEWFASQGKDQGR